MQRIDLGEEVDQTVLRLSLGRDREHRYKNAPIGTWFVMTSRVVDVRRTLELGASDFCSSLNHYQDLVNTEIGHANTWHLAHMVGPQTADRRQAVASRAEVHFESEGGNFDRREGCMGKRVQRHETKGHAVPSIGGSRAMCSTRIRRLPAHGRQFDTVVPPLLGGLTFG